MRLRQHFSEDTTNHFVVKEDEVICKVSTLPPIGEMTVTWLHRSTLPRVSCGLLGCCQPPEIVGGGPSRSSCQQQTVVVTVKAFARMCLYDASMYDGSNIEHFANDAGLLPGQKPMVPPYNPICFFACNYDACITAALAILCTGNPSCVKRYEVFLHEIDRHTSRSQLVVPDCPSVHISVSKIRTLVDLYAK